MKLALLLLASTAETLAELELRSPAAAATPRDPWNTPEAPSWAEVASELRAGIGDGRSD